MSRQKKFESGPFSALSTCVNKAVVSDSCIIVTSSFSETKGFFCFSFNKRSLEDALGKMCFFTYVISQKGTKLQGKKTCRTLFKTPKQNCMRNLEHFWQCSILRKIPDALFPPNPSFAQLLNLTVRKKFASIQLFNRSVSNGLSCCAFKQIS